MSLINVTIQHGQTVEEARRRLETRVHRLSGRCGALVRRIEWPQIVIEHHPGNVSEEDLISQRNAPGGGSQTKEFRHDEQSPA